MIEALFGNSTLVKILEALTSKGSVYATGLSTELSVPVSMIQKQLTRLEKGGWIVPVFLGNKKVYYWNEAPAVVKPLKAFLKSFSATDFSNSPRDPANGLHLPLKERLRLSEELTREGELMSRAVKPKPFVQTFDSIKNYEKWRKKQTNPWLF